MLTAADHFDLLALALDSANDTFVDHVVAPANLRRALKRVVANAGAPGTDGETVRELAASWPEREGTVRQQLLDGTYEPAPIRRVPVPKPGGKGPRMLGIPTVCANCTQEQRVLGMGCDHASVPSVTRPTVPDSEDEDLFWAADGYLGGWGLRHVFGSSRMD